MLFAVPGAFTPGCSKVSKTIFLKLVIVIQGFRNFAVDQLDNSVLSDNFFQTHLPGYVAKAEDLKSQGINEVICVSVNDPFVMAAWAKDQGTGGKVRLLADPSAALAKALDLTVDIAPLGGVSMV